MEVVSKQPGNTCIKGHLYNSLRHSSVAIVSCLQIEIEVGVESCLVKLHGAFTGGVIEVDALGFYDLVLEAMWQRMS